jgi:Ca2+-dependent lipid-binding protein
LDVDEVAYLLSTNPQRKLNLSVNNGEAPVYIYTVKVVLAENLADCDQNGLSDPYVVLQSGEVEMARTRVIRESLNPRWDETFEFRLSASIEVLATVFDKDLVGGDDICGTAVFRLQPSLFGDFLAHDIWLDLKPQGRLLIRVSMEGEKDDIRFHFGKAFRTLKRTQADMARMIVDEVNDH